MEASGGQTLWKTSPSRAANRGRLRDPSPLLRYLVDRFVAIMQIFGHLRLDLVGRLANRVRTESQERDVGPLK